MGLGKKFALPVSKNATPLMGMLVDTDSIVRTCSESQRETLRAFVTHDFLDHIKRPENYTRAEKLIKHLENVTRKFLKDNPDVYVVQSDKGQKTVIIDKVDYEEKMQQHLNDTHTYERLPSNTPDLTEKVRKLMNELLGDIFARGQIEAHVKEKLTADSSTPPRIYGTVKLHKPGMPIRHCKFANLQPFQVPQRHSEQFGKAPCRCEKLLRGERKTRQSEPQPRRRNGVI